MKTKIYPKIQVPPRVSKMGNKPFKDISNTNYKSFNEKAESNIFSDRVRSIDNVDDYMRYLKSK